MPFLPFRFGSSNPVRMSRLIFYMYVFGTMLFGAGCLLSIYGFQSCQSADLHNCSMTLKVLGPAFAVIGVGSILLARSRSRLEATRRQVDRDETDADLSFLCGESRQFFLLLVFGFLFVTCGTLISVVRVWVPGCSMISLKHNITGPDANDISCGHLQIGGPPIILIGLCLFVVAFIKKKHRLQQDHERSIDVEEECPRNSPFHVSVGDEVIMFPPPPPSYFADPLSPAAGQDGNMLSRTDNPPPYSSIFNIRTHHNGQEIDRSQEGVYTIPLPNPPLEGYSHEYFSLDLPPKYEEKDSAAVPDPLVQGPDTLTAADPIESSINPAPPDP